MPMGYGAAFALTIDEAQLKEQNIGNYNQFLTELDNAQESLETVQYFDNMEREENGNDDPCDENLVPDENELKALLAFRDFQKRFKDQTGLPILIDYHDSDESGSSPDEVDGIFFSVPFESTYQLTPQAEALTKTIDIKMSQFVIFG